MEKFVPLFGLLCLVIVRLTKGALIDEFCREQDQLFDDAARKIGPVLLGNIPTNEVCSTILEFLAVAWDTNATCDTRSENLQQSSIQQIVEHIKGLYSSSCPEAPPQECSDNVVLRLNNNCAKTANSVGLNSDQRDMCEAGEEYIQCMENITKMCSGSASLYKNNIFATLASARSTVAGYCPGSNPNDVMQGDVPSDGSPHHPARHPECTEQLINQELDQCKTVYEGAGKISVSERCRARFQFLLCVDRLGANCPSNLLAAEMGTVLGEFENECGNTYLLCPKEVLDGTTKAHSYCLNSIGNILENTSPYCSKMIDLANCLSGLRDRCPVTSDWDQIDLDVTAAGVDEGLARYCQ